MSRRSVSLTSPAGPSHGSRSAWATSVHARTMTRLSTRAGESRLNGMSLDVRRIRMGKEYGPPVKGVAAQGADVPATGASLTDAMRDLLWVVAQHKYGWAHCPNLSRTVRRMQTARALERRGLVTVDNSQPHNPSCSATDAGRAEIERRWPVSPFALGTYEHQPNGWDPVEGRRATNAMRSEAARLWQAAYEADRAAERRPA